MSAPRILCVDDQGSALQSIRILLQSAGYEVVTAFDSSGAEAALKDVAFAAVIIDYQLANSNGADLARKLKQLNPAAPIVMLSGYAQDIPEQAMEWADAFVAKSANTAPELTSVLASLLHREGPPPKNKMGELKRAAAQSLQMSDAMVKRFESED